MPLSILPLLSLLLILLPLTTAIPATTLSAAAEILSNSNYNAISLTLPLLTTTTTLNLLSVPSATLFAPPDTAFLHSPSGQPPLSLLKLHFCPRYYSPSDLLHFPYGSHLPTLTPNTSLTITSTVFDDFVSVNGVKIVNSPIFDNGFLIVYGVDSFFASSFIASYSVSISEFSPSPGPGPNPGPEECPSNGPKTGFYWEASAALRTRGYSLMAGFLDVQVNQFDQTDSGYKNVITVFAPKDEKMQGYLGNDTDLASLFLRHVVGCEMNWAELNRVSGEVVLGSLLKGFEIKIGKNSDGNLVVNGNFSVDFPDFYRSERVIIHGLSGTLTVPDEVKNKTGGHEKSSSSGSYTPNVVLMAVSDHGEF